jgi:outer membrane protein assembly factor BamB
MAKAMKKSATVYWAAAATIALAIAGSVGLAACGSSSSPAKGDGSTDAAKAIVDPTTGRRSGGPIDSSSVSELEVAWTQSLTATRRDEALFAPPVVNNGVVYAQDSLSDVRAIDLQNGEELWVKRYELEVDPGPNGVAVADGRVYGTTPTAAFALDQKTGKELWSVTLTRNEHEAINMAPGYNADRVYVSTQPTEAEDADSSGGIGVLWALDAKTGKKIWHFDTVPRNLWGNPRINAGGGLWYAPAFDGKGSMYFGVGAPKPFPGTAQDPWGSSRPGPNLYTNSIVKLDVKTGKMDWYYQLTPHDLYDWDLVGPPILLEIGGRQLVVAAGKAGMAIGLDAETGKLVWKQVLGHHNGHDEDGLLAMRGEYSELGRAGPLYPGQQGGVTAPMSSNGSTVFAPVVNHRSAANEDEVRELSIYFDGEVIALDAETGEIEWKFEDPSRFFDPYGATTVVNDLVFATSTEGKVFALDIEDGRPVWTAELPNGTNTGVTVAGDTVLALSGIASFSDGEAPEIVAYRLGG